MNGRSDSCTPNLDVFFFFRSRICGREGKAVTLFCRTRVYALEARHPALGLHRVCPRMPCVPTLHGCVGLGHSRTVVKTRGSRALERWVECVL
jgi:hypothetical protein